MAQKIDGKALAAMLRLKIADGVQKLQQEHGLTPGLAVVLVGSDPASQIYVQSKAKRCREVGMTSFEYYFPEAITQAELFAHIEQLNLDKAVHGILVQLPLPPHINSQKLIAMIDPVKDVDGFHPINAGKLAVGDNSAMLPCTPKGCILLLQNILSNFDGLHAVVIGRSNIVGKPVGQLLLKHNCTVTMTHSKTRNLPELVRLADIVVAATGQHHMVRGSWLKPGAIVIDVGINRLFDNIGKAIFVGDVAYDEALSVAGYITPVPGGVGPMTIACLLDNTLIAAQNSLKI